MTQIELLQYICISLEMLGVWLVRIQNPWCWKVGITAVIIHGYLLANFQLIGQSFIYFAIFLPAQIWGWCCWKGIFKHKVMFPTFLHNPQRIFIIIAGCFLGYLWYAVWNFTYPTTNLAIWDSSILAASIIGSWLQIYKKIECWLVWLIPVNISSAILFMQLNNYPFVFLYCVLCVLALLGLQRWRLDAKGHVRK
jgi:nicotinamide mononucleotide transporter PnuC